MTTVGRMGGAGRKAALRIAVSLGLLALLFRFGGVSAGQVARALGSARPGPMVAALVLYAGFGTWLRALRWRVLIRALGHDIRLGRALEIFLIGTTFNQFLPTGFGGDVVRTLLLGRDGLGRARAASTVLVERATGMLALVLVGVAILPVAGPGVAPAVRLLLVASGAIGVVGIVGLKRAAGIRSRATGVPGLGRVAGHGGVARFADSFGEYDGRPLAATLGLSVLFAALLIATNFLLGLAFGIDQIALRQWALMVPLVALSLLVPSIGGLGVREWTYVGLLGAMDPPVAAGTATALSLTFQGLNLVLAAAGGLLLAAGGGLGGPTGARRPGGASGTIPRPMSPWSSPPKGRRRVVVTGAAGFIGSHVVDALLARGDEVVGVDCFTDYYPRAIKERNLAEAGRSPGFALAEADLRTADLAAIVRGADAVVHEAAMGGLLRSWTWFEEYLTCNVLGTQRLLEAVRSEEVAHLVHASTSSVYGRDSTGDEDRPTAPDSPYGVTKLAAENLVLAYHRNFGLPATVLRYFSIFGPRQRPDMGYHIFIDRILKGQEITIAGDGRQSRGNTFVADCVAATLAALDASPAGEVFNIGGGEEVSALDAVAIIEGITGKRARLVFGPPRPGEQRRALADPAQP
ncbi:MAG: flippase-like domain-containing protein, partial [Anaerolineae bacterium]